MVRKISARKRVGVLKLHDIESELLKHGLHEYTSEFVSLFFSVPAAAPQGSGGSAARNQVVSFLVSAQSGVKVIRELHEIKSENMCCLHESESEFSKMTARTTCTKPRRSFLRLFCPDKSDNSCDARL